MAGDWIKMRMSLAADADVWRISESLSIETDLVIGKLHRFWSWASENTRDGRLPMVTAKAINRIVSQEGFAEALEKTRWLKITPTGVRIPKFDNHMADSAKARAGESLRRNASRRGKPQSGSSDSSGCTDKRTDTCTDKSGSRAENIKRAAKSKSTEEENKKGSTAGAPSGGLGPAVPSHPHRAEAAASAEREKICSMLRALTDGREPLFDAAAADAISNHPNATEAQVTWAFERYGSMIKKQRGNIKNPAGYLRNLIEQKQIPVAWLKRHRIKQMANLSPVVLPEELLPSERSRPAGEGVQ